MVETSFNIKCINLYCDQAKHQQQSSVIYLFGIIKKILRCSLYSRRSVAILFTFTLKTQPCKSKWCIWFAVCCSFADTRTSVAPSGFGWGARTTKKRRLLQWAHNTRVQSMNTRKEYFIRVCKNITFKGDTKECARSQAKQRRITGAIRALIEGEEEGIKQS